jgi:hypothetical protein
VGEDIVKDRDNLMLILATTKAGMNDAPYICFWHKWDNIYVPLSAIIEQMERSGYKVSKPRKAWWRKK